MDLISHELDIPKRQISEALNANRHVVLAHKSWVKNLMQNGRVTHFSEAPSEQLLEWPWDTTSIGDCWKEMFITVSKNGRFRCFLNYCDIVCVVCERSYQNLRK